MRFFTPLPFFKFIECQFGLRTLRTLKKFIRLLQLSTALRMRIYFLRSCINLNLTPPHLENIRKYNHLCLFEPSSRKSLEIIRNKHVMTVLRLELRDAFKHLHNTRLHIYNISKRISYFLPPYIENSFFVRQDNNNRYLYYRERIRMDKKSED